MNEQALIEALNISPYDWDLRLQLVDVLHQRGALNDVASIIQTAPSPPLNSEQLSLAIGYGGLAAQQQAEAFVSQNPSDASGHYLLGQVYETGGHSEHAQQHYQAAQSLDLVVEQEPFQEQPIYETAPEVQPEVVSKTGNRKTGKVTAALFAAILVHAVIIMLALILVVFKAPPKEREIVGRQLAPQTKKQELTKKNVVKQVKKSAASAAAAAPVAQLMKAQAVAKFALPDVTKTSTGPLGLGDSGFGSFGTGGTGGGLGSGGSFFGGSSTGNRFLFVLDHSKSMKSHQVELRNKELERALKSLGDGVQYQVLLFAGAALYAEKGWEVSSHTEIKGPGGKKYEFKSISVQNYDFIGPESKLPQTDWLDANARNRVKTMRFVESTKLFLGTDWGMALEIAHNMKPAPDVIFFMADGTGGNNPAPILALNKKRGRPIINTVAMQTTRGSKQFNEVAKKTKGSYTLVDKNGKPIPGDDYLKDPDKFRNRL